MIEPIQPQVCSIALEGLVPLSLFDFFHQLDGILDTFSADRNCSRTCLVEVLVTPNVVTLLGHQRKVVEVFKGQKVEYVQETVVALETLQQRRGAVDVGHVFVEIKGRGGGRRIVFIVGKFLCRRNLVVDR